MIDLAELIDQIDDVAISKAVGKKGVLYFDLETVPDYSRQELFELEEIPEPSKRSIYGDFAGQSTSIEGVLAELLKGTLKDFEVWLHKWNPDDDSLDVIDRFESKSQKPRKGVFDLTKEIRSQDSDRLAAIIAQRKMMSVTPEFNRIVALGWSLNGETQSMINSGDHTSEVSILQRFWHLSKLAKLVCGFNILGFDLPTIYVRSILLDVAPSRSFDMKPWGTDVIDLMAKRFPRSGAMGLKRICRIMGIPIPAGDIDGSEVEELWRDDPAKLGKYVCSDVDLVKELHQRYDGLFC